MGDIRRLPRDRWVLRSSRRQPFYHRRRYGDNRRVDRCYGIRCQNIGCYGGDDAASLLDDGDTETMTSSTTLLPADVFQPALPTEPPTSSIMQFQLIYFLYSSSLSLLTVIFVSHFQFENISLLIK